MTVVGESFPTTPAELSAEWLTNTLHRVGALSSAHVTGIHSEPMGEGVGFVGQMVRMQPTYDRPEDGAPRSLVAKFSSPAEGARKTAALLGLYAREIGFYRDFGRDAGIRIPRPYFADVTADGARQLLLMEDLSDGRFGDQVAGCSLDDAGRALGALARLHARWWNDPRLTGFRWLQHSADIGRPAIERMYDMLWPVFCQKFPGTLPASVVAHGPECGRRVLRILDANAARTTATLRHADYRVDNVFFPASGNDVAVVDWQGASRSWSGAQDAAYFICTGLSVADRRAEGANLLGAYYDALIAEGVHDYPRAQFDTDCRAALLVSFTVIGVMAGAMLDATVNQRAVDLGMAIFERMTTAIEEANAWGA